MARVIGKGYSFDDVLIVPKYNSVVSRRDVDFTTKVSRNYSLRIPMIAANMDSICESEMAIAFGKMGGLGVIHRFMSIEDQSKEIKKVSSLGLLSAAAIGLKDYKTRIPVLVESGVNILFLDIAHGHSKMAKEVLLWTKKNFPKIDLVAGNISTRQAAKFFLDLGADGIKVGIGPGSVCTTRIMTGCGVPQISAIMDCYKETKGKIPICADGGIYHPGHITKAIGAGADNVMVGRIISGTDETPGKIMKKNGKKFKIYRGMASFSATLKKIKLNGETSDKVISVEGEEIIVPCKGPVYPIVEKFLGGLASGMTYVGADCINKLRANADFVEISFAGMAESLARKGRE